MGRGKNYRDGYDGGGGGYDYYDKGISLSEICTGAGVMKLIEMLLIFTTLFVHRFGDKGRYVFFGTATQQLQSDPTVPHGDDGIDCENLGNGSLVTYAIISPVLLLAYCIDGPYPIQRLFLEPLWNFLAVPLFLGLGIKTLMVWDEAKKSDDFRGTEDYATTYSAGIALGALSICIAIVYFCDFILSYKTKSRMDRMDQDRMREAYRY